jgi:2-C-methyl-D-erythritol 2,4-cyclodiphosphate synthase
MELLRAAYSKVKQAGFRLANLDCVVICEKQKALPFRGAIRESLAKALEVSFDAVFVKGKTAEGLGSVGKGQAVEVYAVCLLSTEK